MTPNPNENQAATCNLCDIGFPMVGDDHIPTQSLGMIPVTRCRKLSPLEKPNENQEKHSAELDAMVDTFLRWPLPASVNCDLCATEANYPNRVGTNLLTCTEAHQMLEHVTAPLRTELSTLRKELEAAKKAQEWVNRFGPSVAPIIDSNIPFWFEAAEQLRELLNNGKDGK